MKDLLVLLLIAAFFATCIAYVAWCDRIIGPDAAPHSGATTDGRAIDVAEPVAVDEVTMS